MVFLLLPLRLQVRKLRRGPSVVPVDESEEGEEIEEMEEIEEEEVEETK
jgi:hypothetical protein